MSESPETLGILVARAGRLLADRGFPSDAAQRDAGLLARWVLGWDTGTWLLHSGEEPPREFGARFRSAIDRRALHEPIAYIVGTREFYGRDFVVNRDVLIPRPETEFVVDAARAALAPQGAAEPPAIVDVGTGSGCLAVTLALERPDARVIATDISERALAVAGENARRLGAADRVTFMHGAFFAAAPGPFDLIVANPPYIAERDRGSLPVEVERFEPADALFAGDLGLGVISALLPLAAGALAPSGRLVMEIGQGQLDAVQRLVERTPGLAFDHFNNDLQGIPRVVVIRRVSPAGQSVEH